MLTPDEYITLYEKYMAGRCSPEERALLYAYQDRFKLVHSAENSMPEEQEAGNRALHEIQQTINKRQPWLGFKKWLAAAAAVLLVVSIWAINHEQPKLGPESAKMATKKANLIKPGRNTATLTLANGSAIVLDDVKQGHIAEEAGVQITKAADGQLVYTVKQSASNTAPAYQSITTPRGGQYQLLLPDGTKVWLNAASSLRYPANFIGKERMVELSGEAYFEVSKSVNHPFLVKTASQQVEVLGTAFNLKAYANETLTTTTVASGSVRIQPQEKAKASHILQAGDQSMLNSQTSKIQLSRVNVQQTLSWKNGYFIFDDTPLPEIMNQIARWYDIEVAYTENMQQKKFGGTYNRDKAFDDLLSSLTYSGDVHFKIEGRRVTVMP